MDAAQAGALTRAELLDFAEALMSAYVDRHDLDELVSWRMDPPHELPDADRFRVCVLGLIKAASSEGWLPELINAAEAHRPKNARLKTWLRTAAGKNAQYELPQSQRMLDTAYFDLRELRRVVAQARFAAQSRVLAFGVTYCESVFIRKLADWLGSYLGDTQIKEPLNLKPEFAPVSRRLTQLARYRPELTASNVLCVVNTEGVPGETIEEFWRGACQAFDGAVRYLVLVLTGYPGAVFPADVTVLPSPQFELSDVDLWTHEMVGGLPGWPMELADAWTSLLREEAADGDILDVRFLYEAMDRTIREARLRPGDFRRQLEERPGYANPAPA